MKQLFCYDEVKIQLVEVELFSCDEMIILRQLIMLLFFEVLVVLFDLQTELLWLLKDEKFIEKIRLYFEEVDKYLHEQIIHLRLVEVQILTINEFSLMDEQHLLDQILRSFMDDNE
jgi:hypothetical protein